MKQWKRINLKEAIDEVIEIEDSEIRVDRLTDFHWKINGIDVWPSTKKYMVNGEIKKYNKLNEIFSSIKTREVVHEDPRERRQVQPVFEGQ